MGGDRRSHVHAARTLTSQPCCRPTHIHTWLSTAMQACNQPCGRAPRAGDSPPTPTRLACQILQADPAAVRRRTKAGLVGRSEAPEPLTTRGHCVDNHPGVAGQRRPRGGSAEAGRSLGQPGTCSVAERGLRSASRPEPEPALVSSHALHYTGVLEAAPQSPAVCVMRADVLAGPSQDEWPAAAPRSAEQLSVAGRLYLNFADANERQGQPLQQASCH